MLAVTENFQPGLMSQAMRLLFLSRGPWECPHEAPTWRARPTSSVVEPPARVPLGIHCWQSGARE